MVPTAWTEQSPAGVRAIEPRAPSSLEAAIRLALPRADAVKIGMVPTLDSMAAIVRALEAFTRPVVFDPVLAASSGGALFAGSPLELMPLVVRAQVVTPNTVEVGHLVDTTVDDPDAAAGAGRALCARGAAGVLVKGGHLAGDQAVDILIVREAGGQVRERRFTAPRLSGPSVRGTGCALATAIAVGLARGMELEPAISDAKAWLGAALARPVAAGDEWHLP